MTVSFNDRSKVIQRHLLGASKRGGRDGFGEGGKMRTTHLTALGIPLPLHTPIFSSGRGETPLWPGGGLLGRIGKPSRRESRQEGPALRHRLVVYAGPPPERTGECAASLDPGQVKKVKMAAVSKSYIYIYICIGGSQVASSQCPLALPLPFSSKILLRAAKEKNTFLSVSPLFSFLFFSCLHWRFTCN